MIDHVSIGVRHLLTAKRFYDAALKPLGLRCLSEGDGSLGYGREGIGLWISTTERPVQPDKKSGLHICFSARDVGSVVAFHEAALAAGGGDNGAPGLRPDYAADYFAAYVIDPDGYRLEAYCRSMA
jgi:catechol 2,3-dioxygenase-like lactoylglutathione lyase family enzyme